MVEIFFTFCRLLLCSNFGVLCSKMLFTFIRSHIVIVGVGAYAIDDLLRKSFLVPISSSRFPHFLFCWIQGNWSYVEVLDPLGLGFCESDIYRSIYILLPAANQNHLLKTLSFLQCLSIFDFFVKNHVWNCLCVQLKPLINASNLMPIPQYL